MPTDAPESDASVFLEIDALAQFLACLEMRNVFRGNLHLLAGLRIASGSWRPVIQSEAPKSPDLDALAVGQTFCHRIENHLHRKLGVLSDELRVACRELRDQLRLCHGA